MKYFCEVLSLTIIAHFSPTSADEACVVNLTSIKHASIDVDTITVSGLSSGAFMSNTMHYVFSSKVKGGGVFAGGPFNIAYNLSSRDFLPAYAVNYFTSLLFRPESELRTETESLSNQGIIDPVMNIKGSKSYVYQGGADPVLSVFLGLAQKVVNNYKHFGSDVKFLQLPFGTHCVPTDNYGSPCALFIFIDDGLNNCGIESIFEMFKHFYGTDYIEPASSSTPYTGDLYNFDQSPYTLSGKAATDFMDDHGGIYIPLACQNVTATCKLHVSFHGCLQTIFTNIYYDKFAVHAGYLQAADSNNVIVVFPRAAAFETQLMAGTANLGCWDFFGGTTTDAVPFKQMPQIQSVANILNAIIGSNLFN